MQKLMFKPAAPVATKQCFFVLEEEGCGNILVVLHGIYQDKLFRHCFCNSMEKLQFKITLHSSHQVSALVKQIKVCPLLLGDTSSLCSSKRYTVVVHVFTFLADGLAFSRVKKCQEFVKGLVAFVLPMKLGSNARLDT